MARVSIHIGAHKTATTYIQGRLANSLALLEQHGIRYVELTEFRRAVTSQIVSAPEAATAFLRDLLENTPELLVLSDENIIGWTEQLYETGRLYPNLSQRLGHVLGSLSGAEIDVFLCVRGYESFIPSLYCETIRHRPFISWDEFNATFSPSAVSWVRIVDEILRLVPEHRLHLWEYENFGELEGRVFADLLGKDLALEPPGQGSARESPSAKAIYALEALLPVLERKEIRRLLPHVSRELPRSAGYSRFDPYDQAARGSLADNYRRDIGQVRKRYPRIGWITE